MPIGPGKYNEQLSDALRACSANRGILIVMDGKSGPSFCSQLMAIDLIKLPEMLRMIAQEIEDNAKQGKL